MLITTLSLSTGHKPESKSKFSLSFKFLLVLYFCRLAFTACSSVDIDYFVCFTMRQFNSGLGLIRENGIEGWWFGNGNAKKYHKQNVIYLINF